jgi:hypothetical protein
VPDASQKIGVSFAVEGAAADDVGHLKVTAIDDWIPAVVRAT